jgi:UDP-glucuronate 4-epimerase
MANKVKTILVTGSAGFIGFHLAKKLLEKGVDVVGVDNLNDYYDPKLKTDRNKILKSHENYIFLKGDLADEKFIAQLFKKFKFDQICHLAAQAGVRYSIENPAVYIQSNIVGFANLVEATKNAGVKDFVFASSSSVYGNSKKAKFSVKDRTDEPISLYATTKKADELIAYTYNHLFGLNCTGLRFFTVYGPLGRPDMATFKFTERILAGKEIEVYNFGKMKRDFTYIDDIVSGIIAALKRPRGFKVYNLGNNRPVTLNRFVKAIEVACGRNAKIKYLPLQPGDVIKTAADISESKKDLRFSPEINIEEGMKKFVSWYQDYYEKK